MQILILYYIYKNKQEANSVHMGGVESELTQNYTF